MTNIAPNETVTLTIGKAEALILFELLFDFYRQPALEIKDDALVEPFSKDYGEIISAARRDLLQQWGDPLSPLS